MLSSGVFCASSTMLRWGSSSLPPQACNRVVLAPSAAAIRTVRRLNTVFMAASPREWMVGEKSGGGASGQSECNQGLLHGSFLSVSMEMTRQDGRGANV
eukprot:gene337-341_t